MGNIQHAVHCGMGLGCTCTHFSAARGRVGLEEDPLLVNPNMKPADWPPKIIAAKMRKNCVVESSPKDTSRPPYQNVRAHAIADYQH